MTEIKLNDAQKDAVNHIYGPLLVLAGPGTGKTQLLSARIANILEKTDTNAQNILCLTFTESAAQNMRERLTSLIKDDAYDVHIATYHGFGNDIIRSYPEYFENIDLETGKDSRLEKPIDDLQRLQIISEIVERLPYSSPLIGARNHVKHVVSTISELKRGLFTPDKLKELAKSNLAQIRDISPKISKQIGIINSLPRTADKSIELFSGVLEILEGYEGLAEIAYEELEQSLAQAADTNKSKPLTAWKNNWLKKDGNNYFIFSDEDQNKRILELANIYDNYQKKLEENHQYDFEDMILKVIDGLKNNSELKYNLQEKYQFILLDEFQDTNAAQFELVKQLGDNPVNEDQPNIFAVGDDDQAIYAFQGARSSNMLSFINSFRDVRVINLTENYRSHPDIIHTAHSIAGQIEFRLHKELEGIDKTLNAASNKLPNVSEIERHEFDGEANEYGWVAKQVERLIKDGVDPNEIAILAPRHKYLEKAVLFLNKLDLPISYEKREDILQSKIIRYLRLMTELVVACSEDDIYKMNELFPRVLSLDFYEIPIKEILQTNWTIKNIRNKNEEYSESSNWGIHGLQQKNLAPHIEFFLNLGIKSPEEPLEYVLDYLIGSYPVKLDSGTNYSSPLKSYYYKKSNSYKLEYYESIANLSSIRENLRTYQSNTEKLLKIDDFISYINAYELAEQPLINTHPIATSEKSVQLLTTYKAKGLEFEHVFLLSVHDDVWGKKARTNSNKISLPSNLTHIRYQGSDEDELKRLLFVAITRSKHGLYLTSHNLKDSGKKNEPVKYLLEFEDKNTRKTTVLPEHKQQVIKTTFNMDISMMQTETLWESRHLNIDVSLRNLLKDRLVKYQMNPTHLNTFIDMEYGGPEVFLLQTLLKFPQAPGENGEYGNAVHGALDWYQRELDKDPGLDSSIILKQYDKILSARYILEKNIDDFRRRGHNALKTYMNARQEMFGNVAKSEVDFRKEGVILNNVNLSGKIDRLEIDEENKSVNIVDYKTGKPHKKWENSTKLLKYRQQLYFYKFLIEGSHTWQKYTVNSARLEFVEPDMNGKVMEPLYVDFNNLEETEVRNLILAVWSRIKSVDLPYTEKYSKDYKGTRQFIEDLTI